MYTVRWILIIAVLAAGAIYGIQFLARKGQEAQTGQVCATLAHRLSERLMTEPNPEVVDSRLQSMLRERGVLGPEGHIPCNSAGQPMDMWSNVLHASIIFTDHRYVEVRSAGHDGEFDTADDYYAHEEF